MIVLDTNVLSEVMRIKPDSKMIDWLNSQASDELFLAPISVAEILYEVVKKSSRGRREKRSRTRVRRASQGRDRGAQQIYSQPLWHCIASRW